MSWSEVADEPQEADVDTETPRRYREVADEGREPRFSSDYERIEYDTQMKLCPQGNTLSCSNLGDGFLNGKWGVRDPRRAAKYFEMSCSARAYGDACLKLAKIYESGAVAADDERIYQLYAQSCKGYETKGCEGMRRFAAKTGRMPYSDPRAGVPALQWYCGNAGCYPDPKACRASGGGECSVSDEASCFLGEKPGSVFWVCAATVEQCTQLIKPVVARTGGKAISACATTKVTPPGMVPGNDWYCVNRPLSLGETDCERDLARCQMHEQRYGSRCAPQKRAACVVYFDRLNDKYQGACFATIETCNSARRSLGLKDDFSELSECFAVE